MENNSKYQLKPKYEGIALEFGSQTMVNNSNITDDLAKKLIKRLEKENKDFKVSDLFEVFPVEEIKVKEAVEVKTIIKK